MARAKSETLSVRSSVRRSGILIAANSSEPDFIDPSNAEDIQDFSTVRSVYDGLTQWNTSYTALCPLSPSPGTRTATLPSRSSTSARV